MKTKTIFLWLLLALLVGGVNDVWAGSHTITFSYTTDGSLLSPMSSTLSNGASKTITSSPITLTFTSISGYSVEVNASAGTIKLQNGTTLRITCASDASITGVSFTSTANDYMKNFGASTGTYSSTTSTGTWTGAATDILFTANKNVTGVTTIAVTYSDVFVEYSGSYPYTWDFTTWQTTASSLTADATHWTSGCAYNSTLNVSGGNALMLGDNELPETKGLKFENNASSRVEAHPDEYLRVAETQLYIPNLKRGYRVTYRITANQGGQNAVSYGSETWNTGVAYRVSISEHTFVISSDGTAQFHIHNNDVYIYSIKVEKAEVTTFVIDNAENYYGTSSSDGESFASSTTFTYNPSHSQYIRTRANMSINTDDLQTSDFEITSSNTSVLDPSSFAKFSSNTTNATGGYKIQFSNIAAVKPGTATLTYKYKGSDVYEEKICTETYTFAKATPTVAFSTQGNQTKAFSESSYTNTATASTGATITYSSSDPNVATISSTGVISFVNSGKTTIKATVASTDYYNEASDSYELTVNGTQTPVIAWNSNSDLTESGGVYTAANLPYGNSKKYTAQVTDANGSGVGSSAIRYGVVESYAGYLNVDATKGTITPTRKFADDDNGANKTVQVYAYIPGSGTRNPSNRIVYNVTITKGMLASTLFAQTELTVNAGCTIAPKNNVQSMPYADITAITVSVKTGSTSTGVAGNTGDMISDYITEANNGHKSDYFETAVKDDVEQLANFYPVFKGLTAGDVTFTVTVHSKTYGDLAGDFTLHVIDASANTPLAWASDVKTGHGENDGYTIYEGDYMLIPSITGNCNGNFQYSDGYQNANTHHKYLYTRRWDGSAYEFIYNNRNYKKGQGVPNYELCSDAAGTTVVDATTAGNEVALLFWNVGGSNDTDELLVYGNKAGTIYLRAKDSQKERQLETIKITVKSRTTIDDDFNSVTSAMTFPYTWDFTAETFANPAEEGNGYWTKGSDNSYSLGMQTNINYDYADYDKDGTTWGNTGSANTSPSELTTKPIVSSFSNDKVMRGFAGMQIRTGNNGTGSWYSKRDGIHILAYDENNPNKPRLKVTTGTHTLTLPTPTGDACPATFKVFVKAKALADDEGTLWVRNAALENGASGQNSYYNFKNVSAGTDIIYSVNASKGQTLELDLDKVDVYWVAYSTEAKPVTKPDNTTYPAATYSYQEALDIDKSEEANTGLTTYYASSFTGSNVVMTRITGKVERGTNSGLMLKLPESTVGSSTSCYMIADPKNTETYSAPNRFPNNESNLLKSTGTGMTISRFGGDGGYTNFVLTNQYIEVDDNDPNFTPTGTVGGQNWGFVRVNGSIVAPANMAYLILGGKQGNIGTTISESASRSMYGIVFEDDSELTGIKNLHDNKIQADEDAWFTLQGVRVATPSKGRMYIHKGKKVFLK